MNNWNKSIFKTSIKRITKFLPTVNSNVNHKKGVFISILLVLTPFLFYLYKFAPQEQSWDLEWIVISSGGFKTVYSSMHAMITKLTLIVICSVWFFTSVYWWRYAILVPFTMFLFQLSGVLNYQLEYIDNYDFWYSLPIVLPIIAIMILTSNKVEQRLKVIEVRDKFKNEIINALEASKQD